MIDDKNCKKSVVSRITFKLVGKETVKKHAWFYIKHSVQKNQTPTWNSIFKFGIANFWSFTRCYGFPFCRFAAPIGSCISNTFFNIFSLFTSRWKKSDQTFHNIQLWIHTTERKYSEKSPAGSKTKSHWKCSLGFLEKFFSAEFLLDLIYQQQIQIRGIKSRPMGSEFLDQTLMVAPQ